MTTTDTQASGNAEDSPSFGSEVLTLRAQLRCAFARLVAVEGYGKIGHHGEDLAEVGLVLIDVCDQIEGLYERMDTAGVA